MDELTFTYGMVLQAASDWREQSGRLSTAKRTLSGAPTGGFGDGVAADVTAFVTTWTDLVGRYVTATDQLVEHLDDGAAAYLDQDYRAQQAFLAFIEGKP